MDKPFEWYTSVELDAYYTQNPDTRPQMVRRVSGTSKNGVYKLAPVDGYPNKTYNTFEDWHLDWLKLRHRNHPPTTLFGNKLPIDEKWFAAQEREYTHPLPSFCFSLCVACLEIACELPLLAKYENTHYQPGELFFDAYLWYSQMYINSKKTLDKTKWASLAILIPLIAEKYNQHVDLKQYKERKNAIQGHTHNPADAGVAA